MDRTLRIEEEKEKNMKRVEGTTDYSFWLMYVIQGNHIKEKRKIRMN